MLFLKKSDKKNGFTLTELLTVIAIIAVLLAVVFISYKMVKNNLALDRAAFKLAQDIRRVQGMAGTENAECPSYSYGILFDIDNVGKYILFADCDGNNLYDASLGDKTIETVNFEQRIEIKSLTPKDANNQLWIIFTPPDPEVSITGGSSSSANIEIHLTSGSNRIKTIIINKAGMIEINNS